MIPDKDVIAGQLLLLPNEIAAEATAILNLMADKSKVDQKLDEIETAVKLQINTDKQYTNEGARKSAIKDLLAQNADYEKYSSIRDTIKTSLDLTVIAHQRKRDMINVLIAIAGMKT